VVVVEPDFTVVVVGGVVTVVVDVTVVASATISSLVNFPGAFGVTPTGSKAIVIRIRART